MTRDGASGLPISLLWETHSSGATRREQSLLTAPVRLKVVRTVVGDVESASPIGFDRIDLSVGSGSGLVGIGYPIATGTVVRVVVLRRVVGDVEPAPSADLDGIDLGVGGCSGFFVALISDALATRRVGWIRVFRIVVGDVKLVPTAGLDGVDLVVVLGSGVDA